MSKTREPLESLKLIGGALCLDFANTDDVLSDYGDLLAWAQRAGVIDGAQAGRLQRCADATPPQARTAFDRALSLRGAIRHVFSSLARCTPPAEKKLDLLSTVVGKSATHLRLQNAPGGFIWEWHAVEDRLDWPSWIVARSAAELLISDQRSRVRECASHDCNWLFIDTSRNRSRRWCDMADCGNRAKARRSYARRRRSASE